VDGPRTDGDDEPRFGFPEPPAQPPQPQRQGGDAC
jgi:hypothetical protein